MEDGDEYTRARVKELLLAHEGSVNPISAREINEVIDVDTVDSFPRTRELVREVLFEERIPIVSGNDGYYIVETEDELAAYLANLDGRIGNIAERRYTIRRAAQEWADFGAGEDTDLS